jgi:hypothetical protein
VINDNWQNTPEAIEFRAETLAMIRTESYEGELLSWYDTWVDICSLPETYEREYHGVN